MRAAQKGLSRSDYLLQEMAKVAARPTLEEVIAEIKGDGAVRPSEDSWVAVRAERDSRLIVVAASALIDLLLDTSPNDRRPFKES